MVAPCRCTSRSRAVTFLIRYVLAWALVLNNQGTAALDSMKKAALAGFLPAKLDLVTFIWNGRDATNGNRRVAYNLLKHAEQHKAALMFRCKLHRPGEQHSTTPTPHIAPKAAFRIRPAAVDRRRELLPGRGRLGSALILVVIHDLDVARAWGYRLRAKSP